METRKRLGRSIRALMREQGKNQVEMSKLLGCTHVTANRICLGKTDMKVDHLFKLADWFGVTVDELYQGFDLVMVKNGQ